MKLWLVKVFRLLCGKAVKVALIMYKYTDFVQCEHCGANMVMSNLYQL